MIEKDIEKVLFDEKELSDIVKKLGKRISTDYEGKNLLLVSILKGSVIFTADLMRAITIPCKVDFMCVSAYGNGTEANGDANIIKDIDANLDGVDVLLVEDILDSGVTLSCVKAILLKRNPASVKICTLLDKPERRKSDVVADYFGTFVPNEFVVGYGLDYAEKYRNLPYIGILKREIYEKN